MSDFSRPLSKLQVIARNSDWFIAMFAPVVIGRSNYFDSHFKTSLLVGSIVWQVPQFENCIGCVKYSVETNRTLRRQTFETKHNWKLFYSTFRMLQHTSSQVIVNYKS